MKNKKKERIKMSRKKSGLVGGIITGVIIFIWGNLFNNVH